MALNPIKIHRKAAKAAKERKAKQSACEIYLVRISKTQNPKPKTSFTDLPLRPFATFAPSRQFHLLSKIHRKAAKVAKERKALKMNF